MESQRFHDLVDAYLDHTLSSEQKSELEQAIVSSSEVRRAFWKYVQIHADLRNLLLDASSEHAYKGRSTDAEPDGPKVQRDRPAKAKTGKRTPGISEIPGGGSGRRRNPVPAVWTRWLAIAASLAIVVGAIWFVQYRSGATPALLGLRLAEIQGKAGVIRTNRTLPATQGMELCEGDHMQTQAGGNVVLAYADEATRFGLGAETSATFRAVEGAKRVHLAAGLLDCLVAPQRKSFEIETPHAVATVIGTRFRLTVSKDETLLSVRDGTVAMSQGEKRLEVGAAQAAEARSGLLKMSPAGNPAAYVDGRILFQDSFEYGFADWWLVIQKANDTPWKSTTEEKCPDIRIIKTDHDGKAIQAAALSGSGPKGQRVGIFIKDLRIRSDAFSLSYEYTFEGRPRLAMEGIEIYQDSPAFLANGRSIPQAKPPGSWNTVRWVYVRTGEADGQGRLPYVAKLFFNGAFMGQRHELMNPEDAGKNLLLIVVEGRFRFANVVVRELWRD